MPDLSAADFGVIFALGFPVYFRLGSLQLHPHVVFETLAYAGAFRLYLYERRRRGDVLDDTNRWWVIAAAAIGAVAGSRMLYWLEDPSLALHEWNNLAFLTGGKTIVGALIGGLFAVEWTKKRLSIAPRTGDLFAMPLCTGIAIGRIGCFLTGTDDHTVGAVTTLFWGVNFGDGVFRHPSQLYESAFALLLLIFLWVRSKRPHPQGDIFKIFMVAYFSFRLVGDFLKPDVRIITGLSSIQWACLLMLFYYRNDIHRWIRGAVETERQEEIAWTKS
ncbi:MAG TPA: prolipoprotein diacylglyceryl transferase family protein [Candidatus Acidoferrum sp.]|jgi:prolipoprotein diacylglyceryltransferase|nr:prolipoprotein diacylglyceryl transferase family protein [Candidatus Acidoferrum sp.]